MTQYDYIMRKRRAEIAAEEWGNEVSNIHAFNTEQVTMWYDNRLEDGSVLDVSYNNGRIKRTLSSGRTVWIGEPLSKKSMMQKFESFMEDMRNGIR
jgi:hypothetical protein|tara:strand:+ start:3013 stop:3300 length:288 start_codon:yes stop_codon:yes gene_type:complete